MDFPAVREGEPVYLCWQLGEAGVAHWHGLEEGFAGRRPLPLWGTTARSSKDECRELEPPTGLG